MIYVDDALKCFRESFEKANIIYETKELNENYVRLNVLKNSVAISVWFDSDKQLYGFDMLQGGCKTYETYEEFEDFFGTYLSIYTVFIPNSKSVTEVFEKAIGVNSVFDNFSGNKQVGYTAHFRVLGLQNQGILVNKVQNLYVAKCVSYAEDGSKYKVISEYKYYLDEVGNITLIPTLHSYMDELSKLYDESETIIINRVGIYDFDFEIEDLTIRATLQFDDTSNITYKITGICDLNLDKEFKPECLKDAYDLSKLYLLCKDIYSDFLAEESTEVNEDIIPEDMNEEVDLYPANEQESLDEDSDETVEVEVNTEDDFNSPSLTEVEYSEEVIEHEKLSSENTPEEESVELSIKLVKYDGVVPTKVQFATNDNVYMMSVDKVESLGLDINRIAESVNFITRHGIKMTQEEYDMHSFAKEITDDDSECIRVFNKIFS